MEESISRLAGSTEGQMIWPYEFRDIIWEIGRTPAERSTTYKILRSWQHGEKVPNVQTSALSDKQAGIEPLHNSGLSV
jgi:2-iminoacetate synthase ThiH